MKRHIASLTVFLLLTVLCGFGSAKAHRASAHKVHAYRVSAQNQFHFQPTQGPGKTFLDRAHNAARKPTSLPDRIQKPTNALRAVTQTRMSRVHRHSNPPVSQIGFISATQLASGGVLTTNEALSGDFNGDGLPDVVTLVGDPADPFSLSLSVLLSNGDGTFTGPILTAEPGKPSDVFVVGDLDGDGNDDIIVAHQSGSGISASFDVFMSNGDGTFALGQNVVITTNSLAGGTLEVGQSGHLDAVFVDNANPANVVTITGNGDGTFTLPGTVTALSAKVGSNVVFADLNGDGILDITANDVATNEQTVYLATSTSAFAPGVVYDTPDTVHDACSTTVGDLNGDGKPEIVNANCGDNTITVFVNDGTGAFSTGVYYVTASPGPNGSNTPFTNTAGVTVADVNGDGKADVICSNSGSNLENAGSSDMTVLLGNGDGTVGNPPTVGFAVGGYPMSPAIVADFNGDGLADILVPDDLYSLVYM